MADLKAMFAKKAATQENQDAQVSVAPIESSVGEPKLAAGKANPFARKAATPGQQAAAPEESGAGPAPDESKPAPKLAGFKFARVPGSQTAASAGDSASDARLAGSSEGADRPRLAAANLGATVQSGADESRGDGQDPAVQPVRQTLDSLEALDNLDVSDIRAEVGSGFLDETPATKPTRELPPELETQQLQFVDLMNGVYEILHDPELLGNVIKSIMIELKSNPAYMKLVAPDDIRTWVRAMRNSMGLARIKKTEAKAKRGNGGAKKVSSKIDTDMLADLDGILGIEA